MLLRVLIRNLDYSCTINCLPFINYYLSILRKNHIFSLLRMRKLPIKLCDNLPDTFSLLE